jgi:hypothetical protein
MRKIALSLVAAAAVATPLVMMAGPAEAVGTPGCADKVEWSQVHQGMTRGQVRRLTGIAGWTEQLEPDYTIVSYTRCNVMSGPRPVVLFSTLHAADGGYVSRFQTVEMWTDWRGRTHGG